MVIDAVASAAEKAVEILPRQSFSVKECKYIAKSLELYQKLFSFKLRLL